MMGISVCRTCLASNVKMYHITDTKYQDIYEKVALTKLVKEEWWTDTVCYLCYGLLQRFCRFRDTAHTAEHILTHLYHNGIHLSEETVNILDRKLPRNITRSPLQQLSVDVPTHTPPVNMQLLHEPVEQPGAGGLHEQLRVMKREPIDVDTQPCRVKHQYTTIHQTSDMLKQFRVKLEEFDNNSELTETTELTGMSELTAVEQITDYNIKKDIKGEVMEYAETELEIDAVRGSDASSAGARERDSARGRRHACERCDKSYVNKYHLYRHMKIHRRAEEYEAVRQYTCEICGKAFLERSTLTRHLVCHTGYKKYQCDHCGLRSGQKVDLARHMHKHTGAKPYTCDVCKQRFNRKSSMTLHRRSHTDPPRFPCPACGAPFTRNYDLRRHVMRRHTGERAHSCPHPRCAFTTTRNATYINTHHNVQQQQRTLAYTSPQLVGISSTTTCTKPQ